MIYPCKISGVKSHFFWGGYFISKKNPWQSNPRHSQRFPMFSQKISQRHVFMKMSASGGLTGWPARGLCCFNPKKSRQVTRFWRKPWHLSYDNGREGFGKSTTKSLLLCSVKMCVSRIPFLEKAKKKGTRE